MKRLFNLVGYMSKWHITWIMGIYRC